MCHSVRMDRLLVFTCFICFFTASPVQEVEGIRRPRIIRGETIEIENAPYQVAILRQHLETQAEYLCGGTILSKNHVLTAGHCAHLKPKDYVIRSGSSSPYWGGRLHDVVEITRHKNYEVDKFNKPHYDIAIMKISPEFEIDGETAEITKLPNKDDEVKPGDDAFLTGWGFVNQTTEEFPEQLQGLIVQIMDFEKCSKSYAQSGNMTKYSICARHPNGDRDMCNGDSGGPLVVEGKQVGIVSWSGPGCAVPGLPGVYADVAKYRDWIDEIVAAL